jgi:gliding motility-associatede transport system auxiliary component
MALRLRTGTPPLFGLVYVGALVFVFAGERVLSTIDVVRFVLTSIGVLAVFGVTAVRWIAVRVTSDERRAIERALAILSTCGAAALLVYLSTVEPFATKFGVTAMALESRHRYEALATALWITLLLGSVVPTLFAERALFPMRRAERVEWRRVRGAMLAGLTLALAAAYGTLFTFVAGELDVKADFSYFHTARPSESTRKIVANATLPLRVVAFFPEVNEVGNEVMVYLRDLGAGLPNVQVEAHDRLLVPDLAKDMKLNDDGVIVVSYGADRENMPIGTDMQAARAKLKTLDTDFQKTLLKLVRERRTAYVTTGHGELNDAQPTPENEGRTGKSVRQILEQQNYTVRDLSPTTGLGVEVPDDASIVVVLGPSQALAKEEVAALYRYAERGGRLFLALDPDAHVPLDALADIAGLTVSPTLLANDKVHLRRRFNDSDHLILATNRYSSHASISTLSRMGSRPVFFLSAGALDKKPNADAQLKIDFTVRALPDTFEDLNGNYRFDPQEKRQTYALAAAVTRAASGAGGKKRNDETRMVVLGDSDAVSDAAFSNDGNVIFFADSVRWLGGEESFAGAIATAEDVKIEHTKQKDLVWFYGGIFGAPALVLGLGLLYSQRLRRGKKARATPSSTPEAPQPQSEKAA